MAARGGKSHEYAEDGQAVQGKYEHEAVPVEACVIGRDAVLKLAKKSPFPDGDKSIYACACCGSGEYLFNEDGNYNRYCGNCGQAIDWDADRKRG